MDLVYITNVSLLSDGGGGEERARQVSEGLSSRNHDVTILSAKTDRELSKWTTFQGCDVRHVNIIPPQLFRFPTFSFYATRYLFPLASLPVLFWLLLRRDVDALVENMVPYPSLVIFAAKATGTPIIAVQHEFYDRSCFRTYDPVTASIQLLVQNILRIANYSRVIVPTTHVAEQLAEYGVDPSRLTVIPNGVDVDRYDQTDCDHDENMLITVGRLSKRKGQDLILESFQHVHEHRPETHLHILGKGPARQELEALAKQLDIDDSVTFHGYVAGERKVEMLNQSGLFVFASRQEGFGLVLLEAMAAGLPIIATSLPVYEDFLQDGTNGHLLENRNPSVFTEAVLEMLSTPDELKRIGEMNRKTAKQFSWAATIDQTEDTIQTVVDSS